MSFVRSLSVLLALGGVAVGSSQTCQADSNCSRGQRCVSHFNFASSANCEESRYCIPVTSGSCTCQSGYTCRIKDCPTSPYECVKLERTNTRCGGPRGPKCTRNQVCAYETTGLQCIKCPCYGTHRSTCVPKNPRKPCGPNSIATVEGNSYNCDGCASATSVLTA
ncbi:uncharacterized protein LOC115330370 [Ixodes scapularis]|uniref:uncharacterized protein LOC115330370 n=1 Tax=Ixodes scapularis TaxID=6945 RepID=UPI001A9DF45C|nr:uncharacterized protein LOC115330370 [Ixodes scapularis]